MDNWSSIPACGWMLTAFFLGYSAGLIHAFFKHWLSGRAYCPRCLYYLNWRDTILRELLPEWFNRRHMPEPWDRHSPSIRQPPLKTH